MNHDPDRPWTGVADVAFPVALNKSRSAELDRLIEMPDGSGLTISKIEPRHGTLRSVEWRGTGEHGFYPASIVKLVTAGMTLRWMDQYDLPLDAVVWLGEGGEGDDPKATIRDLLAETIVLSGNDTFNTLQEMVGFAETWAEMNRWGVVKARIRRHFRMPRYNHSRRVRVLTAGGRKVLLDLPARPAADIPLHDCNGQPGGGGGEGGGHRPESNWWCTDDLVRAGAAVWFGAEYRNTRYFDQLTTWCGFTNQCRVREGARMLTQEDGGGWVVLNKPGWWEPDLSNVEVAYAYDAAHGGHYLIGLYWHGKFDQSALEMPKVMKAVLGWARTGL